MKTKRIYSGCYQIGNYKIEKVNYDKEVQWNIFLNGEWVETLSSLKSCREYIFHKIED